MDRKREITAPREAVAKFLLPSAGLGVCLTLFIEVLHMVPTVFPVGHRTFGVKELVSGPAPKRKKRNEIQYREF